MLKGRCSDDEFLDLTHWKEKWRYQDADLEPSEEIAYALLSHPADPMVDDELHKFGSDIRIRQPPRLSQARHRARDLVEVPSIAPGPSLYVDDPLRGRLG